MPIRTEKFITREMMRAQPGTLFVFGDNVGRKGYGGQAREMRGEPNSVGVPTKWLPDMQPGSFFKDEDFDNIKPAIDAELWKIAKHLQDGGSVVWPEDGVGTGLAELDRRAPRIFAYITAARNTFFEQ